MDLDEAENKAKDTKTATARRQMVLGKWLDQGQGRQAQPGRFKDPALKLG